MKTINTGISVIHSKPIQPSRQSEKGSRPGESVD